MSNHTFFFLLTNERVSFQKTLQIHSVLPHIHVGHSFRTCAYTKLQLEKNRKLDSYQPTTLLLLAREAYSRWSVALPVSPAGYAFQLLLLLLLGPQSPKNMHDGDRSIGHNDRSGIILDQETITTIRFLHSQFLKRVPVSDRQFTLMYFYSYPLAGAAAGAIYTGQHEPYPAFHPEHNTRLEAYHCCQPASPCSFSYTWRTQHRHNLHASASHPCRPARAAGRCTLQTSWHQQTTDRRWITKEERPLTVISPLASLPHLIPWVTAPTPTPSSRRTSWMKTMRMILCRTLPVLPPLALRLVRGEK